MTALYPPTSEPDNLQVVRGPRRTDAIGAALRGVFGGPEAVPVDLAQLLRRVESAT